MNKTSNKFVYISHTWTGSSDTIGINIYEKLKNKIKFVKIDRESVKYLDDIRDFEEKLTNAPFVVATIDENYLKSLNSMAELATIFRDDCDNVSGRLFPLICGGRNILAAEEQHNLENYWVGKLNEFNNNLINKTTGNTSSIFKRKVEVTNLILSQLDNIFKYFENKNVPDNSIFFSNDGFNTIYLTACEKLGINPQVEQNPIIAQPSQVESTTYLGAQIGSQTNNAQNMTVYNGPVTINQK